MGVTLDDLLNLAVGRRQGAHQQRHARRARHPFGAGEPVRALQSVLAGKSLGDVKLIGGQNIHAENAKALQERPGRRFPMMLTINVGGSTDSDETDVTVIPVMSLARPDRDHADAARQMTHGAAKIA